MTEKRLREKKIQSSITIMTGRVRIRCIAVRHEKSSATTNVW